MNALQETSYASLSDSQIAAVQQACCRIAPTWPLDQMIAVNPWWELRQQPFADVSARFAALAKVRCLMPKDYYRDLWLTHIQPEHLEQAAAEQKVDIDNETLLKHLNSSDWQGHWHNVADWLDSFGNREHRMAWQDEVTQQASQFFAEFFQCHRSFDEASKAGLYSEWLALTRQDRGLEILMAEPGLAQQFKRLPDDYEALLAEAIDELAVNEQHLPDFLHGLLLDINGWASWGAYLKWQAGLHGASEIHLMEEVLSVRLAWELALWRHYQHQRPSEFEKLNANWQLQWARLPQIIFAHSESQRLTWVWQRASEIAYQAQLHQKLKASEKPLPESLALQAVFCIDVRSEPIRRALEAQSSSIQTRGFAGFFGLPLEYQPHGTALTRPQLPGLLKPAIQVSETSDEGSKALAKRPAALHKKARLQKLQDASPATFSLVEAMGLTYGYKLLKNTFFPAAHHHPVNGLQGAKGWQLSQNGQPLSLAEKTQLVSGVLGAMGLTDQFAETVLLVGHGSETCNNPHAAGLDCGACGGQTGEINVRVLASLLNDTEIRRALTEQGVFIPEHCSFVPALHNTTTDEINCLDGNVSDDVTEWLDNASELARQGRASALNIPDTKPKKLAGLFKQRSRDWSQVRPEWGLANNASFIVAPRNVTRSLDLAGRSFLHDYEWKKDEGFNILELIMTAPMIVTNWINMQYNASVLDNQKYGSGNKVLHNIVGGNLGVFEGNGGDLRIGLAMQSVHDGKQWMHEPLRLSVYLAAPKEAIAEIIERHEMVSDLVNNDWLYIFQWDLETQSIWRYYRGVWQNTEANHAE